MKTIGTLLSVLLLIHYVVIGVWGNSPTGCGSSNGTVISFEVFDQDVMENEDYIQMFVILKNQAPNLTEAMQLIKVSTEVVKKLSVEFCRQMQDKVSNDEINKIVVCEEIIKVGNVQITPINQGKSEKIESHKKYIKINRFKVSRQITIQITNTSDIATLVDSLLNIPGLTYDRFQWMPNQQNNTIIQAIRQGSAQAQKICQQIGQQLKLIREIKHYHKGSADLENTISINNRRQVSQQDYLYVSFVKFTIECTKVDSETHDISDQ